MLERALEMHVEPVRATLEDDSDDSRPQGENEDDDSDDSTYYEPSDEDDSSDEDSDEEEDQDGERPDDQEFDSESWDSDEPPPLDINDEALEHVATYFLPGNHGKCLAVSALGRGTYHEIRVLHFEDGWSCIARFTRDQQHLQETEDGLITMEYVRKHTSIRVPEVYLTNFNENHVVGAAFVLMEKIPGITLSSIWQDLSLEHKKDVIKQIAGVVNQLSTLHFNQIGSIKNKNGDIGPLHSMRLGTVGPFPSARSYILSFAAEPYISPKVDIINAKLALHLLKHLDENQDLPMLNPSFRLIHQDLDSQNILVTPPTSTSPPHITGIIDWDYTATGLAYDLYEYPSWIQDVHWSEDLYAENKILRKLFVRELKELAVGEEEKMVVRESFMRKSYELQNYTCMWVDEETEGDLFQANRALEALRMGEANAYDGRVDWEPDSGWESDYEDEDED